MSIRRFDIEPLLPLLDAGYTLLTPNNRTVDAILREYASHYRSSSESRQSWQRPAAFAIDIYIQQLWQLAASQGINPFSETQLLGRFDEQEIWLQIVRASYEKYPLLNSEDTAKAAARSYRLLQQWDVAASAEMERYRNAVDFQTFLGWAKDFEERCKQLRVVSLSDAGRTIADNVAHLEPILPEKIALINFNQPPPLYEKLFDALGKISELKWQRQNTQDNKLGDAFHSSDSSYRSFQSSHAEIDACIAWCHEIAKQFPQSHIGIVLDHSRAMEPLIEDALFKISRPANNSQFSLDQHLNRYQSSDTLFDTPAFASALSLLSLNHELIDSERFCRILQSPVLPGSESELQARLALELELRSTIEAESRLSQLRQPMLRADRDYHCPILAETLLAFSELARHEPSHQSLRQWLLLFSSQLQLLGWPANPSSALGQRQSQLWQQCCQRLAASSLVVGSVSLGSALGKLQTFLKQSNVNLNFDDRRQISLLDIEEAQDLQFDYLWVLSADDRNIPRAVNAAAFLPYSLQQALQMPESCNQQQLDTAIAQLITLRQHTRAELVMSYHSLEEGLSVRPSALLREIAPDPLGSDAGEDNESRREQFTNTLEKYQESLHIPLNSGEEVSGGTGLLTNQSNCPFRAFARNRLQASRLESFSQGLNSLVRGNALHKALEYLGQQLGDSQALHGLSSGESERLLERSADIAIDYLRKLQPETMTPAFSTLERGRLVKLLAGFLNLESERSEFTILHNEKRINWRHSRLSLDLRIDRIDRLADGSLALIDYKTGKYTNYKWFDQRPDDLQLPLYQIAVSSEDEQAVGATLIFQLNAENIGLISPLAVADFGVQLKVSSQAKSFEGGWPALQAYWNDIIHALVAEFESGLVAVAPTRGYVTCQYCDLGPLCRIAESDPSETMLSEDEL